MAASMPARRMATSTRNRNIVAHGAKEAVIDLMDADSLGAADHQTPLYQSPRLGNDAQNGVIGHCIWAASPLRAIPTGIRGCWHR